MSLPNILESKNLNDHKGYQQVLWSGLHLDGTLTVVYCSKCNEDYPSDIPGTIIVDFTLISNDTQFVGSGAITPNTADVSLLLEKISESYKEYILGQRKNNSCTIQ